MSESLLFTDRDDLDTPTLQAVENSEEEQINIWSEIQRRENYSFLTLLKRLCIYWRRILLNKIRLTFTLIFVSMLNVTARITCFTRQRRPSPSSFTPAVTSSSLRTLEENLNDSSQSLLLIDNTHNQTIDLPSLQNSKMAHILVQQQIHRSPSISIHPSTSSLQTESKLPMTRSVDDRVFLQEPSQLIHFFKRFASEPHISKYQTQSTNSNGHFSKSSAYLTLSTPVSNSFVQVTEPEKEDLHFEEFFYLNCDKIQPVSTSLIEEFNSDKTDNIITIVSNPSTEQQEQQQIIETTIDEDILFDTSPSINNNTNNNDVPCERHFRRRKRRSSITKNSLSLDDTQTTVDLLEKLDINQQQQSQEIHENLDIKTNDNIQNTDEIETKISENKEESNETKVDDEKSASVSRYRGRRLRHRFYRHASSTVSPSESSSNVTSHFYLPHELSHVDTPPRMHSPPSPPVTHSSLPSSISPTLTINSNPTSPNSITGGLKRVSSAGSKKNVRFADSVGRELTQVQYIHSSTDDESKEFSFLLNSSLLSSSPPSFNKNNLYLSNKSCLEHKPWSFDVALTTNHKTNDIVVPKRFFCLYRQPNSEHPDIYLHEIWKSQIKLEYADIPLKCSSTGEQQLLGKLWVTNAGFSKYVSIKYTFNHWLNTYECEAQHRCHSNDFRNIDQFEFTINLPADVDRIDFVLRYCVNGQEHWDNNEGKNYVLQTESAYIPSTTISLPHDCDFNEMRFY